MNEARFEQWLTEALATDVQPGDGFTSRVMERVAATPQEPLRTNGADKRKLRRMLTALAACAAIVILIPLSLLMMPMGKSAPAADGAAMESFVMDDAAADTEYVTNDSARFEEYSDNGMAEPADGADADIYNQQTTTVGSTPAEEQEKFYTETAVYLEGSEAKTALAALSELGIVADIDGEEMKIYYLSAEETEQLRELLPHIIDAEGAVALTLEVGE